jgi:hypothetical protein
MTPEQRIKREILQQAIDAKDIEWNGGDITAANIDEMYALEMVESDLYQDYESEFRCSGEDTGLDCESSRHYESKAVARELSGGFWVGWTYWYGGGKHGEPEAVEWMEDAYEVSVIEEQKMVTVRTFSKPEVAPSS